MATPAISGGLLVVRTLGHVFGLGEPAKGRQPLTHGGGSSPESRVRPPAVSPPKRTEDGAVRPASSIGSGTPCWRCLHATLRGLLLIRRRGAVRSAVRGRLSHSTGYAVAVDRGDSDLIVVARVDAVESLPDSEERDAFEGDVARLHVLEVWKGSIDSEVSVTFGKNVICPAPPRYVRARPCWPSSRRARAVSPRWRRTRPRMRARADRPVDEPWFTVALSYARSTPGKRSAGRARPGRDALALPARSPLPESEQRAWNVRAASRRVTRWHGACYALDRRADEVLSHYDRKPMRPKSRRADERREVMRGFIQEPSDDHTVAMTLVFVGALLEPEFDRAVLGQAERLLAEEDVPYWLGDALARWPNAPEAGTGVASPPGLKDDWEEPNARALRRAWDQARGRYGIPQVPPAPAPPPEVRGVAGLTPD